MVVGVMHRLARAVAWTAGLVEGAMSGLAGGRDELGALPRGGGRFGEFRAALLGRHRRQIVRALGAPPTACVADGAGAAGGVTAARTFWQATTWYYPFDAGRRQAVAIRFVGNRASAVEFIGAVG